MGGGARCSSGPLVDSAVLYVAGQMRVAFFFFSWFYVCVRMRVFRMIAVMALVFASRRMLPTFGAHAEGPRHEYRDTFHSCLHLELYPFAFYEHSFGLFPSLEQVVLY